MAHCVARRVGWLCGAGVLLVAIPVSAVFVVDALGARVAAGLVAHNLCSATFVAGVDPQATFNEQIRTILPGAAWRPLAYQVDRTTRSVAASFGGLGRARARFTPGYGCRLDYPENVRVPAPRSSSPVAISDAFAPATAVVTSDSKLAAALRRVFIEHPSRPIKDVKAVVIVKDGQVVAERYAPGFGIDTPLLSYSVAKSFTNALLGVLVRRGRLRVDQPAGAPEWAAPGDVRGRVTIEDLARMRSGLDVDEAESVSSPVAVMEYARSDMAGFAARHSLKHPAGTAWEYTSANTLILDRLLGREVGGGAAGMRNFAERELFAPLHMAGVTMEFDGTGVFVGSSYVYASARTYARFGELYLDDGVAFGRPILPRGFPNMVYGMFATSTIAAGRLRLLDIAQAERAPGVVAVMTHRNAPRAGPVGPPVAMVHLPLQDELISYEGQPIALVVADTLERATYAAGLVRAEYEPEAGTFDLQAGPSSRTRIENGTAWAA